MTENNGDQRKGGRTQEFGPGFVSDVSEALYRELLPESDHKRAVEEGGEGVFRTRGAAYDRLTRAYLRVLQRMGRLS